MSTSAQASLTEEVPYQTIVCRGRKSLLLLDNEDPEFLTKGWMNGDAIKEKEELLKFVQQIASGNIANAQSQAIEVLNHYRD